MIACLHTCYVISDPNNAKSRRSFSLLAISAWRRCIIDPGHFLTDGLPVEIIGGRGVVAPAEKRGDRGVVPIQYRSPSTVSLLLARKIPEAGFRGGIWQQYDSSAKLFGCNQRSEQVVTLMENEEKKKIDLKRTIDDGDNATRPLCLDTNKLTVKR